MRFACGFTLISALGFAGISPEEKVAHDHSCKFLGKKLSQRRVANLKNKIYLCEGKVLAAYRQSEEFPEALESHRRFVERTKTPFIVLVQLSTRRLRRHKAYLLSTEREVIEVLTKGARIEFSGQLFLKPYRVKKKWQLVFLNQEVALKL